MGNFSFLCKKCNKPILSTSSVGQPCKLFLLKDGNIVEEMEGQYDGYGKVLRGWKKESVEWWRDWHDVVELMFLEDKRNGIAAFHLRCYDGMSPLTRSEPDPNQGWDDYFEAVIENPAEVYDNEFEETN